jgi:hypothetical protein
MKQSILDRRDQMNITGVLSQPNFHKAVVPQGEVNLLLCGSDSKGNSLKKVSPLHIGKQEHAGGHPCASSANLNKTAFMLHSLKTTVKNRNLLKIKDHCAQKQDFNNLKENGKENQKGANLSLIKPNAGKKRTLGLSL